MAMSRDQEVRSVLDAFRTIIQALRAGARHGERKGLSSAQLFALQQIAEHPNLSINDLAALTFTHHSSVSVVVRRLVGQGMAAKIVAENDRRRQTLAVTEKGERAISRAPAAVQERLIAAIAGLTAADRRVLSRSLEQVALKVAPRAAGHAPMLFEDHRAAPGGASASARAGRRASRKSKRRARTTKR